MLDFHFVNNLLLDVTDLSKTPPWQWITHIFVHMDYNHLLNNLSAVIQISRSIYQEFGGNGLYLTFFLGGVLASVPSSISSHQQEALAHSLISLVDSS